MKISTRLYDIILILSFVALWISVQIDESLEYTIGYFLVLSIGVGHGANDLKIYFKNQNLKLKTSIKFICIYAGAVILGFLAFFIIQDLILALFLIVSGFHFGQEHFERYKFPSSIIKTLFITCYGLSIIVALLHLNIDYSLPIVHDLIDSTLTAPYIRWTLYTLSAITIILGIIQLWRTAIDSILKEILYLIVIYIIFASSSLIWGFAIYFILWHSVPSIHHQIQHLHGSVTNKTILNYIQSSILFWLVALLFLGLLYYFLNEKTVFFLSVIVAFLGGITFPHVFVMHRIHKP
tara:strand:- start:204 stop:1085 length:882 start_codon:yes stop_codon:yes gene_type:complete